MGNSLGGAPLGRSETEGTTGMDGWETGLPPDQPVARNPASLTLEHFVRNSCRGCFKIAILFQFLPIEPHVMRKSCRGGC